MTAPASTLDFVETRQPPGFVLLDTKCCSGRTTRTETCEQQPWFPGNSSKVAADVALDVSQKCGNVGNVSNQILGSKWIPGCGLRLAVVNKTVHENPIVDKFAIRLTWVVDDNFDQGKGGVAQYTGGQRYPKDTYDVQIYRVNVQKRTVSGVGQ